MSKINKFRAFDLINKSYINQYPLGLDECNCGDEVIYEQFIGIKDINDREIYEGDILKYTEKMCELGDAMTMTGVVKYDETFAAYGIAGGLDKDCNNYFTDMVISNFCILGNINENIDLI